MRFPEIDQVQAAGTCVMCEENDWACKIGGTTNTTGQGGFMKPFNIQSAMMGVGDATQTMPFGASSQDQEKKNQAAKSQ